MKVYVPAMHLVKAVGYICRDHMTRIVIILHHQHAISSLEIWSTLKLMLDCSLYVHLYLLTYIDCVVHV